MSPAAGRLLRTPSCVRCREKRSQRHELSAYKGVSVLHEMLFSRRDAASGRCERSEESLPPSWSLLSMVEMLHFVQHDNLFVIY